RGDGRTTHQVEDVEVSAARTLNCSAGAAFREVRDGPAHPGAVRRSRNRGPGHAVIADFDQGNLVRGKPRGRQVNRGGYGELRARGRETVNVKDRSIARITGLIEHGDDYGRAQRPRWHGQGWVAESPHGVNDAAGRTARRHAAGCLGANIAWRAANDRSAAANP